jgi:hypothetical protein
MNAKRITLAGILMIAIAAAGCSHKGAITGPAGSIEELTSTTTTPVSTPAFKQSHELRHWLSFDATIQRTEIEGGCWYLQTDKGERYEADFGVKHALTPGTKLRVKGYLEPWISSYCMIGPVLRIVDYQVMSSGRATDSPTADDGLSFTGVLGQAKQGCYFITTDKMDIVALELRFSPAPSVLGSRVKVSGNWSALPYSPCDLGPLFVVDQIEFLSPPFRPVHY